MKITSGLNVGRCAHVVIKEIEERQKASKAALMLRNKEKKALVKQKKGAEKQAMKKSSRASEMHPALSCHVLLAGTTIDSIEEETAYLEIFMELLNEEASLLAEDILAERNLERLDAGSSSSSSSSSASTRRRGRRLTFLGMVWINASGYKKYVYQ